MNEPSNLRTFSKSLLLMLPYWCLHHLHGTLIKTGESVMLSRSQLTSRAWVRVTGCYVTACYVFNICREVDILQTASVRMFVCQNVIVRDLCITSLFTFSLF